MSGRFIAMVGPSGVGKDSVMEAMVAGNPKIVLARRVITRLSEAGGEAFDGVSEKEFQRRADAGDFALHWPAHGLHYGILQSVDKDLVEGKDVLANLSRAALIAAKGRFARFKIINLTAARDVLDARLVARGRETSAQIAGRLDRASAAFPEGIEALHLDNSGRLDHTVAVALDCLYPVKV